MTRDVSAPTDDAIGERDARFSAAWGAASTQPGVIGFSREGDGAQGASFTRTAIRAVSFFGPGVQSISGALTGVTGVMASGDPTRNPSHLRHDQDRADIRRDVKTGRANST
jgi:hypothetical protein